MTSNTDTSTNITGPDPAVKRVRARAWSRDLVRWDVPDPARFGIASVLAETSPDPELLIVASWGSDRDGHGVGFGFTGEFAVRHRRTGYNVVGGWTGSLAEMRAVAGRLAGAGWAFDTMPHGAERDRLLQVVTAAWQAFEADVDHSPARGGGHPTAGAESFDSLAWTTTRDGDLARCVECGECGSHPEHQPEALAEQAAQLMARVQ